MNDAFSFDGRTVEFTVDFDTAAPLGGYMEIDPAGGGTLLAQVVERRAEGDESARSIAGIAQVIGSLAADGTIGRGGVEPFASGTVRPASAEVIQRHLDSAWPGDATLDIGRMGRDPDAPPARLRARGFSRHTFLCGQSGSGKTYTLGVVLEQLLVHSTLPVVVLDPNSDHVHLGEVDPAAVDGPDGDPFARRLAEIGADVHVFGNGRDLTMRVHFGGLPLDQQATVLRLDPLRDPEEYRAFLSVVGAFGDTRYNVDDLVAAAAARDDAGARRLQARIENLRLSEAAIWAHQGDPGLAEQLPDSWRGVVLDLGSLPSPRDRIVMATAAVAWTWERRHLREPVLLVIDEAHNVCPAKPMDADQAMATDLLVAIAGEGRKYGIHLLLATQRPQKLHENVLSQCDNLLLMRMNSSKDIDVLAEVFSHVPAELIGQASGFGMGEGLAAGPITSEPVMFATGRRYTPEGGSDVPAVWARRRDV